VAIEFKPHKYQELALKHILEHDKSGLFLDMGLGKTVVTLTAINTLIYDRLEVSKVLIIAPLRVAQNTWFTEKNKWKHLQHLRMSKVLGSKKERFQGLNDYNSDIFVINRENVQWLATELGTGWLFDMVVIDELSSFKSAKAERFKALKKCISYSQRVVGLTGTPAPNGLIDLWSQLYLLDQGERLGKTITSYRDAFFSPNQRSGATVFNYKLKSGSEETIRGKIEDICISMSASDWLEMPDKILNVHEVVLSDLEMEKYNTFEKESYLNFKEGEVTAVTAAALTMKLLQYVNGAMYYDEAGKYTLTSDSKLEVLSEIVDTSNGKSVLVFYSFVHDLERLQKHFGKKLVKLTTEDDIIKWNNGEIEILAAHPAAAGHGLNLQYGGNIIVWFGITWSLELYQQANARLYRQGQKEAVIIHHLVAKDTVDEVVMASLQNKADVQDELLESLKVKFEKG
jgi:SNF2 family DNA or RNA helicase